jgi:hypothetical protein
MIYVVKNPSADTRAIVSATPTGAPGEEAMTEAAFIAWRDAQPPLGSGSGERWRVSKDTIITRLSPGDLANVMAALGLQSAAEQFKFTHSAWFWSDNETLRGLCAALGIDGDALLAPDPFL